MMDRQYNLCKHQIYKNFSAFFMLKKSKVFVYYYKLEV